MLPVTSKKTALPLLLVVFISALLVNSCSKPEHTYNSVTRTYRGIYNISYPGHNISDTIRAESNMTFFNGLTSAYIKDTTRTISYISLSMQLNEAFSLNIYGGKTNLAQDTGIYKVGSWSYGSYFWQYGSGSFNDYQGGYSCSSIQDTSSSWIHVTYFKRGPTTEARGTYHVEMSSPAGYIVEGSFIMFR